MKGVVTKRAIFRVFFWPGTVLTVAVVLFLIAAFSAHRQVADAQMVNFYASECSGGWDGVQLAAGEPQVTVPTVINYTKENSAYLENKTSPILCGQFTGTLPPETYHTRVMVRFSWKQESPLPLPALIDMKTESTNMSTSTGTTTEATSEGGSSGSSLGTTSSEFTSEATSSLTSSTTTDESASTTLPKGVIGTSTSVLPLDTTSSTTPVESESATTTNTVPTVSGSEPDQAVTPSSEPKAELEPVPSPVSTPEAVPTPASNSVSFWPWVLPTYAHAEELSTSSVEHTSTSTQSAVQGTETATNTVVDTVATSADAVSLSTTVTPDGTQFVVQYTLDGTLWHILGYVSSVDNDVRLEFPKEVLPTLDDISHIKLSVTPLLNFDTMQPVYLDAIWLEVSYAPLGELGVHGISDIVPTISPFDTLISDVVIPATDAASTSELHMTTSDFVNRITKVHGIDERYVLVSVLVSTSTTELWLFDMTDHLVHRIGSGKAQIGTMQAGSKDGMIFWLNAERNTIYTYDLRTAGSLHEMMLVGNLPAGAEYVLTFPFTSWQVIWRGDAFYFRTRKTGEVFQDENTDSASKFFTYFNLKHALPFDRIQTIGGTFISEGEDTFSPTSTSTAEKVSIMESASTSSSSANSTSTTSPAL